MLPRTARQAEILRFIESFTAKRGAQPSYGVIARHIGVKSRATVAKHIKALERRGILKREGTQNGGDFHYTFKAELIRCPSCDHRFMHRG